MPALASFSSETQQPDKLIAGPLPLSAAKAILITGQNVARGAVLGKITASGKYNLSLSAAVDGSQVPDAIAAQAVDATAADAEILVYTRGYFNQAALTLVAAHTVASIREGLRDKNITLVKVQES